MSEEVVQSGQDLTVSQLDRRYGGRRRTLMQISGDDGTVAYSTDVSIQGNLVVNGRPITGSGSGGSLVNEILGRPLKLSNTPSGDIGLFVNGQLQHVSDYVVDSDNSIHWRSPDFTISLTDLVEAVYQI